MPPHTVSLVFFATILTKLCRSQHVCPDWTQPDLYPPSFSVSQSELFVVDCIAATNSTKLAATTLQGVVNAETRRGARVYMLLAAWDLFWLNSMQSRGLMPSTNATLTPEQFFSSFSSSFSSCVIPDVRLTHTINVATMIAASDGASIVVEESMSNTLCATKRVTNLSRRWNTSVEAYRWAFENLYQTQNLSRDVLAYYHPYWLQHHLRDFLIQHKVFVWYISASDGDKGTALMMEIMQKTSNEESTRSLTVLGFIAGGPPEDANAYTEYSGVGLMGR